MNDTRHETTGHGLTLLATTFTQGPYRLFTTSAPLKSIRGHLSVDKWNPDLKEGDADYEMKQGYQRDEVKRHYGAVARYFQNESAPFMPGSIVVVAREGLNYDVIEENEWQSVVRIMLPPEATFWIVDGQHRIRGAEYAFDQFGSELANDMNFNFTILTGVPKLTEVRQFYIMNTTSKRLRTDLAERLLLQMAETNPEIGKQLVSSGKKWKLRATKLTIALNELPGSPWQNRIKVPHSDEGGMASESSFSSSLRPLLGSGFPGTLEDDELLTLVDRFWRGVRSTMPEAFKEPSLYVVQKTPGIYALHMLAPRVLEVCRTRNDFQIDTIRDILLEDPEAAEYFNEKFWRSRSHPEGAYDGAATYNSMGAFRQLANDIEKVLPEIKLSIFS